MSFLWRGIWFLLFAVAATFPLLVMDRFQAEGDPLLAEEFNNPDLTGWEVKHFTLQGVEIGDGTLWLRASDFSQTLNVQQSINVGQGGIYVQLSGTVASQDVIAGEKSLIRGIVCQANVL